MLAVHPAVLVSQDSARPSSQGGRLTKEQFDALGDNQTIEVRGKAMTKREILALATRHVADAKAKSDAAEKESQAALEAEVATFQRSEEARIDKENAETRAAPPPRDEEDTPAQREKAQIRAEAMQLRAKAGRTTNEAELAEIHRRAQELLAQLKRHQGNDR